MQAAAVVPFAALAIAKAFEPSDEVIAQSGGKWANGCPYFTGFKLVAHLDVFAGQWLVVWNPLLPIGYSGPLGRQTVKGNRAVKHQFFYSNVIAKRGVLDLHGEARFQAVESLMRAGLQALSRIVGEQAKYEWRDWTAYRRLVAHARLWELDRPSKSAAFLSLVGEFHV